MDRAQTAALPQILSDYTPHTFAYTCRSDLEAHGQPPFPSLEDWVKIFYDSINSFVKVAGADPSLQPAERAACAAKFATSYRSALDTLMNEVPSFSVKEKDAKVNCLELCRLREVALREAGFRDPFLAIKAQENMKALELLPAVCAELDAETNPMARWELIVRGICAANIFDLGAAHTTNLYHRNGGVSFHDTREQLLLRPWVIDSMDALIKRLTEGPRYKKALLFVDNSGADVVLGMLPFARELLRNGTDVIIAANEVPSINDITAAELDALLPKISAADPALCKAISTRRLIVMSSGNDLPVIDVSKVSAELASAAVDVDFIVLEGMGRSIETNLNARLTCDALKIGMVKHPEVAAALGGRMLDCVVQFDSTPKN